MRSERRVLVTGHEGYIGSVLTGVLLAAGWEVVGVDAGYMDGCDFLEPPPRVPTLRREVGEIEVADLRGFEAVVHLAALSNDPLGDLDPAITLELNGRQSAVLADRARRAGVRRFVFSSSCSVYGRAEEEVSEGSRLLPQTAYAESKVLAEEAITAMAREHFSPTFLRNATVYGSSPRMRFDLVVNNLVGWAHTTGEVRLQTDGTAWRPIVHVEDLSRAFLAVLEAPKAAIHGKVLNIGSDNHLVREIAEEVVHVIPGARITFGPDRGRDTRSYRVNFDRAARALPGLNFAWRLREGIEQVYGDVQRAELTFEDFQGRRYNRLAQMKHLQAHSRLATGI